MHLRAECVYVPNEQNTHKGTVRHVVCGTGCCVQTGHRGSRDEPQVTWLGVLNKGLRQAGVILWGIICLVRYLAVVFSGILINTCVLKPL